MSEVAKRKLSTKSIVWLIFKLYVLVFLLVFLGWGIHLGWHAYRLVSLAKGLQGEEIQISSASVIPRLQQAAGDSEAIHRQLSPLFPVFNALRGLPGVGRYLVQIDPWLTFTDSLAQAVKELTLGLEPLLDDVTSGDSTLSLPERFGQAVETGQAHISAAGQALERVGQVRGRLQPELLPGSIQPLFQKLDDNFGLLVAGVQMLKIAPTVLGTDEPQTYLVLAQNRDELRATGGFISGIGLLSLEDGKILKFTLGDSYQVDDFSKAYPEPPEAIHRFMLADYWVTRDANWSPDYPTTARAAQDLYTLSTGVQTQGVVAFNQLAIRSMLAVLGPVVVPGTEEPVTAGNVEEFMRQAWAPAPGEGMSAEWWAHRKDFMQLLGGVILEKALSITDQAQLIDLAKAMVDLLDQGQILVYFSDPGSEAPLVEAGWDGGVHPGDGDYLYLVDSNIGFNKVDSVIARSLKYQLDLSDLASPLAEVTLGYQHTGSGVLPCKQEISYGNGTYQDLQQRCYLDYWRVYVPAGSALSISNVQPVPAEALLNGTGWTGQVESLAGESGTQVFAGLLMVPFSTSSQVQFSYSHRSGLLEKQGEGLYKYTLLIQVQPGQEGMPFQFEVRLPEHSNLVDAGEGWESLPDHSWTWQGTLQKSTRFVLSIQITQTQ